MILARTLSDQVIDIVRESIVAGTIPEGVAIRQDSLAAELGVSKIPLREALGRLEHEGLLTSHANRGYFVRPRSTDEATEIYHLRLLIEPSATALGAQNATPEDRRAVEETFKKLDEATRKDLPTSAILNRDFHAMLVGPGNRRITSELVRRLLVLSERYVVAHLTPTGRAARAHMEHQGILDAWLAGDSETVKGLIEQHISKTLTDLELQFSKDEATPS